MSVKPILRQRRHWHEAARRCRPPDAIPVRVIGIVGWSGSGKTTLITRLLPLLIARGLSVSTIKHAHHGFDMDRPGKDSHRHREAGAHDVLVASAKRWALLHENDGPEPPLPVLLGKLDPVDVVLVEGFKRHAFPKLEVYRPALCKPPIWVDEPAILAIATDAPDPGCPRRQLPLNNPETIAGWLLGMNSALSP